MDGKEVMKKFGTGVKEEEPKGLEAKFEKLLKFQKETNEYLKKILNQLESKDK